MIKISKEKVLLLHQRNHQNHQIRKQNSHFRSTQQFYPMFQIKTEAEHTYGHYI